MVKTRSKKGGNDDVPLSGAEYEQQRAKRIKENKERLQKLGIFELSKKLNVTRNNAPTKKPNLRQPLSTDPPRRSFRVLIMKGAKSKGKADNKLGVNRKPAVAKRAAKDPNKPKRAPSAFFVFLEDFRKQFKEKHPNNKSVAAVGKAAGEKWKSLTEAGKAPYVAKAEQRKTEYEKNMRAYNNKQAGISAEEEESDKSKSDVNDEDDDGEGSEEEEDDD